jgi:hypothetical protein
VLTALEMMLVLGVVSHENVHSFVAYYVVTVLYAASRHYTTSHTVQSSSYALRLLPYVVSCSGDSCFSVFYWHSVVYRSLCVMVIL